LAIYRRFQKGLEKPGDMVIKLYHSGDEIRGFVRKVTGRGRDYSVFPGEEMEPAAALQIARSHLHGASEILIELSEGVEWDARWGALR
jgi:hypothetical protein